MQPPYQILECGLVQYYAKFFSSYTKLTRNDFLIYQKCYHRENVQVHLD